MNAEMEIREILDGKAEYEPHKFVVKSMYEILGLPEGGMPLYVVTSPDGRFGGYGILDKGVQREVQDRLGGLFFAIPSSIHEFICAPIDLVDAIDLLAIVKSVNLDVVDENEQVADALYYFDGESLQYAKEVC